MAQQRGPTDQHAQAARRLRAFARRVAGPVGAVSNTDELDAATVQIFTAFTADGIDALALKGPGLARLLYEEDEHRTYSDVDLLVSPRDVEEARASLAALGYRKAGEARGIDDVAGVVHEEMWTGPAPGTTHLLLIELHLWFPGSQAPPQVVWDALARRRTRIELRGHEVPVLNEEGLAMHLAIHAAQHGPAHPRGLRELELGLERWPSEVWGQAAELAAEIEAGDPFAAGLRLVAPGIEVAEALGLSATDRLDWEIRHRDVRPRGTFHLQAVLDAQGWRARADVVRFALLPSREWITWHYRWARPGGARLPLAYAVHLLRAPAWAFSAWRFRRRSRRAA